MSTLLFKTVLKDLGIKREVKGIQTGREEVKLSLYADDMILHAENSKDSTQKLLEMIDSTKYQDTRLTFRNCLYFFTITINVRKVV